MKAINFKQLATFSFAALLLASCSDSNNEAGNADANAGKATTIVGSAVTSITDAQTLAARVSNLKITSTSTNARTYSATRATRSTTTPKQPTVPTDAKNITEVLNDKPWDAHPGNYYVDSDVNNSKINIKGMNIYIKNGGTFVHNSEDAWDFNTHIYVLNGGKLIARNEDKVFSCNKVDNWGTIEFPTSQNTYLIQNTFNNYGDLNVSDKTLQIESNTGNVAVYGNLVAKDIKLNSNAPTLNCTGDVTVEKIYLTNSSTATINETLTTTGTGGNVDDKNGCAIYLDSNSKLVANCAVKSHNIYVTNGSTIKTRYIKAQNYFQDSNAKVQLQNQSLFDIADTYNNQNNGEGSINLGEEGVAVIKCKKVQYNSSGDPAQVNNCKIFTTSGNNAHIIIDATDGIYNNSNNKIEVNFDGAATSIWPPAQTPSNSPSRQQCAMVEVGTTIAARVMVATQVTTLVETRATTQATVATLAAAARAIPLQRAPST